MEQVRTRKLPWQLLHRRMKEALLESTLSDMVLKDLYNCVGKSAVTFEDHAHQKSSPSMDMFEAGSQGVNVLTGFAQAVAMIMENGVEDSAPEVNKVAQDVNEYANVFCREPFVSYFE